ncbi:MAG: transcription termination/antitermination protein NusA [Bacteroidia bacterium]|jgi:transcription termination/antitermination protein NusA|nr:transcription termination/antitermination protein NusA [Sphingobacteriaceae bacterium]MBK7310670.1 transcription termination/antitermination protein NusA [Sphingobacteriaceae bacterium]MBP9069967.1 transcription termination/antitermination protein NusA [Bacteroidia bacterium]
METSNLIESFSEFKDIKNIDRATLMSIIEDVFRNMLIKKYGSDKNFDIIVNPDKGDVEIYKNRQIVDDEFAEDSFDYDEHKHISLTDAKKIEPDFEIGEDLSEKVDLEYFGRRAVLAVRQNLVQKILELEKSEIYNKYKDKVGDVVTAEVYQVWKKEIMLVDDEGNELLLPKTEQIPSDFFKKGDTLKAVVSKVEMKNGTPSIIVSRTSPAFLERLFENEVPEIFDGLITIKKVVREPGERAKVAVESYDDRIDPVGACVGMKGSRIHGIVRELKNENIDVINFTTNPSLFIQRALSPAKITTIKIDEENKSAEVFLKPDQISLAIGKGGYNIKLAGKLTGYEIDVFRDTDIEDVEDVDLDEFTDEIEADVIEKLKSIGCDTAKSVLELNDEEITRRTGIEDDVIAEVRKVLASEFED